MSLLYTLPEKEEHFYYHQKSYSTLGLREYEGSELIPTDYLSELEEYQQAFMHRYVYKTAEELTLIANMLQGTDPWKDSRIGRITASNFGAAANHSEYDSADTLTRKLLDGFTPNEAMLEGQKNEPVACRAYIDQNHRKLRNLLADARIHSSTMISFHNNQLVVEELAPSAVRLDDVQFAKLFDVGHAGLYVDPYEQWRGASVDGICVVQGNETGLLEIKCPKDKPPYKFIPLAYYDQMQGGMHILRHKYCDFFVWTRTKGVSLERIFYDGWYCNTQLMPKVRAFYFERYLPALTMRYMQTPLQADKAQPEAKRQRLV